MKYVFILLNLSFLLAGCATTPPHTVTTVPLPEPYPQGIYHTVLQGQTLWKIAKAYNRDINQIIDINRISDPSKIDAGQMIFIPDVKMPIKGKLRPPVTKSEKGYIWPIKGRVISYFGSKKGFIANKGIDIEAEYGQAVLAACSGKVVFCDENVKGLGKVIIIDHGGNYSTLYANNSSNLVKCGDYVKQSQPIARAGNTGRAKRPTLHFQIRKGHEPQNPFYYLP